MTYSAGMSTGQISFMSKRTKAVMLPAVFEWTRSSETSNSHLVALTRQIRAIFTNLYLTSRMMLIVMISHILYTNGNSNVRPINFT
jgi:hypothetical protein